MARLNKKNLFTGLIGPVVLSSWKDIPTIKSKNRKSKKPPTVPQLAHRQKWSITSKFINSMKDLLERTYHDFAIGKTGANAAFKYNFKNFITGAYPSFSIDYSLALVSRGDLPNASNLYVEATGNGQLQFSWTDNSGTGQAKGSDKFIGVIHYPEQNRTVYSIGFEKRQQEMAIMNIRQLTGKTVECWGIFISANEQEVADSVYIGRVIIL